MPSLILALPFAALVLAIAIFPLLPHKYAAWWERNRNKLLVSVALSLIVLAYYFFRPGGITSHGERIEPGLPALRHVLLHAIIGDYFPFIILLFSLYTIAGGIRIAGDIPAHPSTNTAFLFIGALLANLIGTTGASMLLIRPLLHTNSERKRVAHTVIFFIFVVSNIGGCLLPIGDPPLFLGYLRGVPFLWTMHLWKEFAFALAVLLIVYYIWDSWAWRQEAVKDIRRDETQVQRIRILGWINFVWLIAVVLTVALLDPSKPFPGTTWKPRPYLREVIEVLLVAASLITTPHGLRNANKFNFTAIGEVACLFIGIFITMQVPLEILNIKGSELGLAHPWQFFWAAGGLSSFLDNAPTYVVFFQTANAMTTAAGPGVFQLLDGNFIRHDLLAAISCGAVFMGANTYIGNGPNFMVKSIAEHAHVKMPSFFGYMVYSGCILIPLFVLMTLIFFR